MPTDTPPSTSAIIPPAERASIAMVFVREALAAWRARGVDCAPLLLAAGIAPASLADDGARVSPAQFGALWRQMAASLDDEFFGLADRPMKAGSFTLLCHSVLHAGVLQRALLRMLRFLRVTLDGLEGELRVSGEQACIVLRDLPAPGEASAPPRRAFAYGAYWLMVCGVASWLTGRRLPLTAVDFPGPEPAFSPAWRAVFCPQLNFEQPVAALYFPAQALHWPLLRDEAALKKFLRQAPANFLALRPARDGMAARIHRQLRATPPAAWPDFASLARQLHLSPATLRRRLAQEGQSYRRVQEAARQALAMTLLANRALSLAEVASALGFAETSAFCRAFKRWTGQRPGDCRP
jgi:AraC-like DNA-binding protein